MIDKDLKVLDGRLVMPFQLISGTELVMQRLRIRLKTQLGTWPLDTAEGIPYLQWLELHEPNIQEIRDYFRKEIQTTPGVVAVKSLTVLHEGNAINITAAIDIVESVEVYRKQGFLYANGDLTLQLNSQLTRQGLQSVAILPLGV